MTENKPTYSLGQLTKYFLRLGTIGFGGPVALIGYMHQDLVEQRKWISEENYRQGLALAQLAPGPLAAQLAIYLPGYIGKRNLCISGAFRGFNCGFRKLFEMAIRGLGFHHCSDDMFRIAFISASLSLEPACQIHKDWLLKEDEQQAILAFIHEVDNGVCFTINFHKKEAVSGFDTASRQSTTTLFPTFLHYPEHRLRWP